MDTVKKQSDYQVMNITVLIKKNMKIILFSICILSSFVSCTAQEEQKKPNIVYLKKIKETNSPSLKFGKKNLNIFFKKKINLEAIATIFNINFLRINKIFFKSGIFEDILFNFKYLKFCSSDSFQNIA